MPERSPTTPLAVVPRAGGPATRASPLQAQPLSAPPPPLPPHLDDRDIASLGGMMDHAAHSALARLTGGLSPAAIGGAFADWWIHLLFSPGKQYELSMRAWRKLQRLADAALPVPGDDAAPESAIQPQPGDRRFADPAWQQWPFKPWYETFLLQEQWWHEATTQVKGVTRQHEGIVDFATRQLLDVFSPSNWLATNPVVLQKTLETNGQNLVRGGKAFLDDARRALQGRRPAGADRFAVGRDVAATLGKVIYRNRLIELIQYAPTTGTVRPEPVLIVPAWIMKYYILDLSPQNSLVRFLVDQGFTVFMISWLNPGPEDRDLSMEDYRRYGVLAALEAINAVAPDARVHTVGYCLGGTLLAIAAAALARDGYERIASMTLFAAQVDFTEAGELMLFINESQVSFLESLMWSQGTLDAKQMAGAFQLLRSNDLIWSHVVNTYLMGGEEPLSDLMAWNSDATRMPYRMHSEYLRRLFLDNDLAEGRFVAGDRPVALNDLRIPSFAVGTERDHVAPWRSVYKLHLLADCDFTFVLASGGHNAGIVSEPGRPGRHFRIRTSYAHDRYTDPEAWVEATPVTDGSWWPAWTAWLAAHSGDPVAPPPLGRGLGHAAAMADAPGAYVLQP